MVYSNLVAFTASSNAASALSHTPSSPTLSSGLSEYFRMTFSKPVAYITQTTLSVDDTAEIIKTLKEKFPEIKQPVKEDICYATTNRQLAVKEIAPKCDLFFVIGSRNSSNSVRLVEVAKKAGCKNSMLMYFEKEIPIDDLNNSETIGISSGASAPEGLVQNLLNKVKKDREVTIEEVVVAEEKVIFKLPKQLN